MAYREFTDGRRRRWRAWDTYPHVPTASAFSDGWLTFECLSEPMPKRRLAPVPEGWERRDEPRLRELLDGSADAPTLAQARADGGPAG